mgnify:CR=1 FL=1
MKKALLTALWIVCMTLIFGVGIYHSNYASPNPDTLFLFPGQQLHFYAGIEADTVQYLEFRILSGNYQIAWNDDQIQIVPLAEDFLMANGTYVSQQSDPWLYKFGWVANDLDSWVPTIFDIMALSALHFQPQNAPLQEPMIIDVYCLVSWEAGPVNWVNTVYDWRRFSVVNHNRPKGDVNNDGTVDATDVAIAMSSIIGCCEVDPNNYLYSPGLNFSAGNIVIPWPNSMNVFLMNFWLHHPDDPLVVSLGIGQPFTYGDQGYVAIDPEISGQTIRILPDGYNNVYAVQGRYADGRLWSQSIFLDRGELLRFGQGSIDPSSEPITRDPVEFIMPEGVSFVGAIARQLGSPTSVSDPTTPAVTSISCYPNPFGEAGTTIKTKNSSVSRVEIYNIKGQKIRELNVEAKSQEIHWDGRNYNNQECPAGLYFMRVTEGNKLTIIRAVKIH